MLPLPGTSPSRQVEAPSVEKEPDLLIIEICLPCLGRTVHEPYRKNITVLSLTPASLNTLCLHPAALCYCVKSAEITLLAFVTALRGTDKLE